jgi:hypothetical protein
MTAESPQFDFYISATDESGIAQEVARVLREAGHSIYLPDRNDEIAAKRFAANKSKAFVLPLVNDSQQSQFLADILDFAAQSTEQRRVVVIQFEDCDLARLIDSSLITNLSGLIDSRTRKLRIIDAVEVPLATGSPREADERPPPAQPLGEDTPRPELETPPPANRVAPYPAQHLQKIEEVNLPSVAALNENTTSTTPQSEPGPPQQYVRYDETTRPSADVLLARSASFTPRADIDQSEPERIYETGDPAIDDPLTALVEIISEKDPAPLTPSPLRPPKWLSKELAATRTTPAGASTAVRQDKHAAARITARDILEFAISHPTQFSLGVPFIVDVLIYRQNNRRLAVLRAAELSPHGNRFRSSSSTEAARGTKLRVAMTLPWPTEPATQTVYWNGGLSNVSFQVITPKYATSKTIHGSCEMSVDGLTIGQVHFQLQFGKHDQSHARQISRAPAIKSAFASYANQDRRRMRAQIQGVEQLGVSVFTDVNGLRGNELSKKQIFQVIDSSDILYLFWSKHAKRSTWIDQEWRYGMEKKGAGFIDLVPLVDPSKAALPLELADRKLFQNGTVFNSDQGKSLSLWEKVRSWLGNWPWPVRPSPGISA